MTALETIGGWCAEYPVGASPPAARIEIGTLDNPGWRFDADLAGTELAGCGLDWSKSDLGDEDWFFWGVREQKFQFRCDPLRLGQGLSIFVRWMEGGGAFQGPHTARTSAEQDDRFMATPMGRLASWYLSQCNGDWEHCFGMKFTTAGGGAGWNGEIDIEETELEQVPFEPVERDFGAAGRVHCSRVENKFVFTCGPTLLERAIEVFVDWVEANRQCT